MEFVLIAYAILIGLGVAEILRGFADLVRAESVSLDRRSLMFGFWVLAILLQVFWAMWRIGGRVEWAFAEFLLLLLPAILMYLIARITFPISVSGADLGSYYERTTPALWGLTAALYVSFAAVQPLLYSSIQPALLVSQLGIAVLALSATRVCYPPFHLALLGAMLLQLAWRGFVVVVA
jgi:hypothetical protein